MNCDHRVIALSIMNADRAVAREGGDDVTHRLRQSCASLRVSPSCFSRRWGSGGPSGPVSYRRRS
jgi:hypothetical protein